MDLKHIALIPLNWASLLKLHLKDKQPKLAAYLSSSYHKWPAKICLTPSLINQNGSKVSFYLKVSYSFATQLKHVCTMHTVNIAMAEGDN